MKPDPMGYYLTFHTPFGRMAIVWERRREKPVVRRILLLGFNRHPGREDLPGLLSSIQPGSCPSILDLSLDIKSFLTGRNVSFDLSLLLLDLCPPFQRRVLLAENMIPRGCVSTYGRIARHIGSPGGARAVGRALAKNPFPIVIPCHRALRADLSLGGYQGGLAMKRKLLEMEGIRFDPSGRVESNIYIYY